MRNLTPKELSALEVELKLLCEARGFEAHAFKVGWYNAAVADKFAMPYSAETLAFVIISQPSMFEKAFLPFAANNYKSQVSNIQISIWEEKFLYIFKIRKNLIL
jgi:hypothetical protein